MNKKIAISLLAPVIGTIPLIVLLPSTFALPFSLALAAFCGWWGGGNVQKTLLTTMGMLAGSFLVLLLFFIVFPQFFQEIPFYASAAAVTFAFWIGMHLARVPEDYATNIFAFFLLGIVALFGVSAFSFLGNEDFGLYGRILLFGFSGFVLARGKVAWHRQLVLLGPIIIVAVLQYITEPSSDAWFLHIVMPLVAVLALTLGNLAAKGGIWPKVSIVASLMGFVALIQWVFPIYIQQSAWGGKNIGSSIPAFELVGLSEDTLRLRDISNKVVWVELYSARCKPCLMEMASVENVTHEYANTDQVKFITVSSAYFETHQAFLAAENYHKFKLWHGYEFDSTLAKNYAPNGVPVALLVDKHGRVRFEKHGFHKRDAPYFEADLKIKIDALLAEQ
jgi:peroxiredoxin